MKSVNFSKFAARLLLSAAALPFMQLSAQAIVINDAAGAETARELGAPFTAVAGLTFRGGSGSFCTGSLIDKLHVLTAQHCIFGGSASDLGIRFRDDDALNTTIADISVANILEVDPTNFLVDGTDIAILELSAPAPESIMPLRLLTNTKEFVGSMVTTVGFGFNGVGSEGHQFTSDGLRWAAENTLDFLGGAAFPPGTEFSANSDISSSNAYRRDGSAEGVTFPGSTNILSTDFDTGLAIDNTMSEFGSSPVPLVNEGTTAPGDSGSPLLVKHNDEFLIAGVLSGGTTFNSVYGDISWWTGSEKFRPFIEANGGEFVSTPEASSPIALLALGAVNAGLMLSRKRKA